MEMNNETLNTSMPIPPVNNSGVEDFENEGEVPPTNWLKWKELGVGAVVQGTFESSKFSHSDEYGDNVNITMINVSINKVPVEDPSAEYMIAVKMRHPLAPFLLNKVIPGQRIGLKFEKEIPPSKKGWSPAQSITVKLFGKDPNYQVMKMANESMDEPKSNLDNIDYA